MNDGDLDFFVVERGVCLWKFDDIFLGQNWEQLFNCFILVMVMKLYKKERSTYLI